VRDEGHSSRRTVDRHSRDGRHATLIIGPAQPLRHEDDEPLAERGGEGGGVKRLSRRRTAATQS